MENLTIKQSIVLHDIFSQMIRTRMLNLLLVYDWIAGPDFNDTLDIYQQYQHRHILFLKRNNILNVVKKGVPVFYSIKPEWKEIIRHYIQAIRDQQLEKDLSRYTSIKKYSL